jgi:hypothetical protein
MIGLMMILAAGQTEPILPVQQKLEQIDRTFICPESLPSDEARQDAVKLFVEQLRAIEPNLTIRNLVEYRMALLEKHGCTKTLENIKKGGSEAGH